MKRCVECKETLPAPGQTDLCDKCFQTMLDFKIDTLGSQEGK